MALTVASGLAAFLSLAALALGFLLHHSGALRFAHEAAGLALLLGPALAGLFVWKRRADRRSLARMGTEANLAPLLPPSVPGLRFFGETTAVCAVLFAALALMGPQMGASTETVHRTGLDVFFAVDVSRSMDADDLQPTRLKRAVMELEDFLETLEGNRAGLIAFAGDAFIECPLTLDYGAVKLFLDVLDTGLIAVPGTDLGAAIEAARKGFGTGERKGKVLILLTDGEDHGGGAEDAAQAAAAEGVVIYTIGIGSPQGAVIPVRNDRGEIVEYKKDGEGQVVTSRLDEGLLQKVALATGGKYYRSSTGRMELRRILDDILKLEKKDLGSAQITRYESRYQYVLLPAFLLFALSSFAGLSWRKP
jgi:Ca-activated chloride channel family protein